uniref:Anti-FecI sigma factor, FecR n=1 Tax=Geobacter sp. (strain M21) TaxID=443144 RepID=C6DY91_GEOSM
MISARNNFSRPQVPASERNNDSSHPETGAWERNNSFPCSQAPASEHESNWKLRFPMQSRLVLISLLLPLLFLGVPGAALAEVVGKLTVVEGAVDIMPGGQLPAVAAKAGGAVQKGDFVRTKSNARAELTFNDGSVVKIAQRSRIDVGEYSAGNRKLALPRGKVQATVIPAAAGGKARSFEIRTPNAIAGVRGTSFYVYHQANVTGVAVLQGVVHTASVSQPSKGVTLVAGTATTVTKRSAPTPPRPVSDKEMNSHQSDVNPTGKGGEPQGAAPAPAGNGDAGAGSSGSQAASGTTSSTSSTTAESSGSDTGTTASSGDSSSTSGSTATSGGSTTATGGESTTTSTSTASAGTTTTTTTTVATGTGFSSSFDPSLTTAALSANTTQAPVAPVTTQATSPTTVVIPVTDASEEAKEEVTESAETGSTMPADGTEATDQTGGTTPPPTDPTGGTTPPPPTPPVFSGTLGGGLMSRSDTIDPASNLLAIVSDPGFAPVISGTTSPWATKSASISLTGSYPTLPLLQPNHYWFGRFFSDSTTTHTTTDGGAFFGYFGGMSIDNAATGTAAIDTSLSGIYVDPTGKIGLMQGGAAGDTATGKVSGTGSITLTEMTPTSPLVPTTFGADWWNSKTGTTMVELFGPVLTDSMDGGNEAEGFLFDAALNNSGTIENRGDVLRLAHLAADPSFGIWTRESFGSYAGSGTQLVLSSNAEWGTVDAANIFNLENSIKVVSVGNWQEGALTGKADGVWADLAGGNLKLLTGTLTGSANPGASTFGAVTTGVFIDLNRFLANPTLAAGLGFPTVAGSDSFTLSGSNTTGSVSFGSVNFYNRTASPISFWVAQNVSGSFGGALQNQNFSLMDAAAPSVSNVMGNLWMSNVSLADNTWLAQVNVIGETGASFRSEFDGVAVGTVSGTTFSGSAAGIAHPVTYYNKITGDLKRHAGGSLTSYGTINGVMAGMSLWSSTPALTAEFQGIGFLTPSQAMTNTDYIFSAPISSFDVPTGKAMTADGGAYYGHMVGGVSTVGGDPANPGVMGVASALYVDPSGKAGVLRGKFFGFLDPYSKIWHNEGEMFPVQLEVAPTVTAATLNDPGSVITATTPFGTGGTSFTGYNLTLGGWSPDTFTRSFLAGSPQWGIGQFGFYAPYSAGPAANNPWGVDFVLSDPNLVMVGSMEGQMWDPGRGQMSAGVRAAWYEMVDVSATATPRTGIFLGETVGTFNPVELQSMTSGMWLETNKFLSMVASDPGALNKLKIPAVEVGKADFSGGNSEYNVTLQNVRFFAPVATDRPQIFATDSITGSYVSVPTAGSAATLNQVVGSGVNVSGFSPTFTIKQWDTTNSKWSGSLQFNGTGGMVGTHPDVKFTGVAAGRSNAVTSTFTGTAAGVVK